MDVLLYTHSSGGWVQVHFMAHFSSQALGVFTRLSGEVREELRGVCTQTFNFLQENSFLFFFFFYNPSLLFVVFPIMPIRENILLTDVTVENFYTWSLPETA